MSLKCLEDTLVPMKCKIPGDSPMLEGKCETNICGDRWCGNVALSRPISIKQGIIGSQMLQIMN